MAGHDARGPNLASLDGDALVAGEGGGDGCALDGVGAASSGTSLGELGAWIVCAAVLGLGLLEVDQLARGEGCGLGQRKGSLVVDVGGGDGATAEELLLDLVPDHWRNGDGTRLRRIERRCRGDGLGCHQWRLLDVLWLEQLPRDA